MLPQSHGTTYLGAEPFPQGYPAYSTYGEHVCFEEPFGRPAKPRLQDAWGHLAQEPKHRVKHQHAQRIQLVWEGRTK